MWVFVDDDNGDDEMIISTIKIGLYGPFGAVLKILAAENGKSKKYGCHEPNFNLLQIYNSNL